MHKKKKKQLLRAKQAPKPRMVPVLDYVVIINKKLPKKKKLDTICLNFTNRLPKHWFNV